MEYRTLGNSGLQVSAIGLGTNQIGGRVDLEGSKAIVNKCIDLGITFFDGADIYGGAAGRGKGEEVLGAALKPHRRNVVLATKSAQTMGEGPYWAGNSRRYLADALDACLRRLDTDYIDFYQIHRWDTLTPMEETMRFLDDAVRSGKVRYVGHTTFNAWQATETEWISRAYNLTRCIGAQNEYNLLNRTIEADLIPVVQRYKLGFVPFYPLASGFLTGKYRPGEPPPPGTRLANATPMTGRFLNDANFEKLVKLEDFAEECGHSMLELALSWLVSKPYVTSVIAGATNPEQIEQNVKASEWRLTAEEFAKVDEIQGFNQAPARPGMPR